MSTYRLYGLDPDGRVLFGEELRAQDLGEARDRAEAALSRAAGVELWHGGGACLARAFAGG